MGKTNNIYRLMVSVAQEFGEGTVGLASLCLAMRGTSAGPHQGGRDGIIEGLTEARRHKVALSRGGKQVASPTGLPEGPQDVAVILTWREHFIGSMDLC